MFLKSFSINRLIVLIIAGGFLFLFVETLIEHQDVIPKELPAFIPIIVSILGFIIALLTAQNWKDRSIRLLHFYLMLTILVGLGGLFFHNKERFEREEKETETIINEKDAEEVKPPILAPAALIGFGAVGLIGTARKRQAEIREKV